MRLRWSNGHSAAVEFDAHDPAHMANALCDALIEFRKQHGQSRIELHVNVSPDRWTDPSALSLPDGSATYYCHVINLVGRAPDADGTPPQVRGTDHVLVIGPGAWHADDLFSACMHSIRHSNQLSGLGADVIDAIVEMQQPDEE